MRYEFKPSFEDSVRNLSKEEKEEKEEIKAAAIKTVDILSQHRLGYKGIGLKRLKDNYWEIRRGLKIRIIFRWSADLVEFILAGSHDRIKQYLRNLS